MSTLSSPTKPNVVGTNQVRTIAGEANQLIAAANDAVQRVIPGTSVQSKMLIAITARPRPTQLKPVSQKAKVDSQSPTTDNGEAVHTPETTHHASTSHATSNMPKTLHAWKSQSRPKRAHLSNFRQCQTVAPPEQSSPMTKQNPMDC